jgi:hypothetical protein
MLVLVLVLVLVLLMLVRVLVRVLLQRLMLLRWCCRSLPTIVFHRLRTYFFGSPRWGGMKAERGGKSTLDRLTENASERVPNPGRQPTQRSSRTTVTAPLGQRCLPAAARAPRAISAALRAQAAAFCPPPRIRTRTPSRVSVAGLEHVVPHTGCSPMSSRRHDGLAVESENAHWSRDKL